MNDIPPATIRIGVFAKSALAGLARAIDAQVASDREGKAVRVGYPYELRRLIGEDGYIFLRGGDHAGRFEPLESTLRQLAIPYDRYAAAPGQGHDTISCFRPGMKEPEARRCDRLGRPVLYPYELQDLFHYSSAKEIKQRLHEIIGFEVFPLRPVDVLVFGPGGGSP